MANGQGGKRVGAGRKKKALAEKILEGNRGHEKLTKIALPQLETTDLSCEEMPNVSDYLKKMTKNTTENIAPKVFEDTWKWLKAKGCESLVKQEMIEQYALYIARWVQCEEGISTYGLLAKHPTTNMPIASPYVQMGLNFLKQANILWGQIYQIVKENCSEPLGGATPNDDMMEKLLSGRM
ncbi:MAG: terminase [Clostridia bacterium]